MKFRFKVGQTFTWDDGVISTVVEVLPYGIRHKYTEKDGYTYNQFINHNDFIYQVGRGKIKKWLLNYRKADGIK